MAQSSELQLLYPDTSRSEMQDLSEFVAQLVKSANVVNSLSDSARLTLLAKAYTVILDSRQDLIERDDRSTLNHVLDLLTWAAKERSATPIETRSLLLKAAEAIRKIKISKARTSKP